MVCAILMPSRERRRTILETICTQKKPGTGASRALGVFTTVLAVLGPIAMVSSAIVITLMEGDWWFNLFLVFLGGIALFSFSLYVSIVTLLWELTRHARRKAGMDTKDTPVSAALHRILLPVSMAGVISVVTIPLFVTDLINGAFMWIHLACGGVLLVTLTVYGIHAIIRRRADRRRDEAERLAQEKQAWDEYLS